VEKLVDIQIRKSELEEFNLEEEIKLAENIFPEIKPVPNSERKTVFVTGATGTYPFHPLSSLLLVHSSHLSLLSLSFL
jgi:hypothetical protein